MVAPLPPVPSEQMAWRARVRSMLTERLGLKATALAIAVLLWLVIGARQPTESYVSVHVMPVFDRSLVLLGDPPHVRALVAGRAADIVRLHVVPPVLRRTIDGGTPDSVVLHLVPADVHFPADMASDVRVVELDPRTVTLHLATRVACGAGTPCGAP